MSRNKGQGWFKPYILNPHNIEKIVEQGPGVYVLGNVGPDKKMHIKHIRSSSHVKNELREHVGKFHVFMYKPYKFHLQTYQSQQQTMQFA